MGTVTKKEWDGFFTKDKAFYKTLISLLSMVALQNIVAYSVNMTDNLMLGAYNQNDAMAGAAIVNQIFFIVQQLALSIGEALVVLAAQYWGQNRPEPIRKLTGIALKLGVICGLAVVVICAAAPHAVLMIFTNDPEYMKEGIVYLSLMKYTFLMFMISNILMASLRSVGIVRISFLISIVTLVLNAGINYTLIFGHFGFPELGIRGSSIGTFIARSAELLIVVVYMLKKDGRLRLFQSNFLKYDPELKRDFTKVAVPVILSQVLWAVSVPMQTAILGHLSPKSIGANAVAANAMATTFYQYLKVMVVAMSSTSAVMIGNAIGRGDIKRVKSDARTLSVIDLALGIVLGVLLYVLRLPLLHLYNLTPQAAVLADQMLVIMSFIMVGMSYQMPVSMGLIRGGGDARFTLVMNMISTWAIVMPLSYLSAFWWKWPVAAVVIVIQSDQVFKCVPTFLHFRKYGWVKKLTRANNA